MNEEQKTKSQIAEKEEKILEFWKENKIFEKSLEKESPKGEYVFYDGPPFATGLPHYGHILASTIKDAVPRYWTMRGFHVERRWGWDCHGLPIENIVEKDLHISGKKEIEEYGVQKFNEYARSKVLDFVSHWKDTVDRIGRWVDFDGSYKTMDNTFIESVWWGLKQVSDKGLLYEGTRVLPYCPRCETPIANSEIAMDGSYKDITDISVYVKFELVDEPGTYLIAWTTTPWSLPGDTALAINKNIKYVKVAYEGKFYILAEERVKFTPLLKDIEWEEGVTLWRIDAEKLLGKTYIPPFDYYIHTDLPHKENIWKIWHADFVTVETGTGIAHEAPVFGEEDMDLAKKHNIPFIYHVGHDGKFTSEVTDFAGIKVKPKDDHQSGDVLIIKNLAHRGLLFAKEKIVHSYPHCFRCETPLYYFAIPAWFIKISEVKDRLLSLNEKINWIPEHLKEGRFKKSMEGAPDWNISRNRYWASPLPIWKDVSGKYRVIGGLDDLKKLVKKSGNAYFVMRHGETKANVNKVWDCDVNNHEPLTEHGIEQVKKSAESLKGIAFDLIISSPYERTKETAKIVAIQLGMAEENIIFDPRIGEWNVGKEFNGKSISDFLSIRHQSQDKHVFKSEDGESYADVVRRTGEFLYDLEKKYSGKNILIVSHGAPSRALSVLSEGVSPGEISRKNVEFSNFINAEIRQLNFVPLPHNVQYELDLHRPYIDEVELVDENGSPLKRVSEVMDCWFESGAMPFAQHHYPFENKEKFENNFPAQFVAEYIAQTRTWFYYTHAVSGMLFDSVPFENVVTTGTVLAEDGEKMSKSKGNYPDPWILINKYSVDAIRLYMLSSVIMKSEDLNFSEKGVDEVYKKVIQKIYNILSFYEMYRIEVVGVPQPSLLDTWIVSRLNQLIETITVSMNVYEIDKATRPIMDFVDDFSVWYVRRSRDRFKSDDMSERNAAIYHTAFVLREFAKAVAPFMPFLAEEVYRAVTQEKESVHLCEWPQGGEVDAVLLEDMRKVRETVTSALELRQKSGHKVRQPLASLTISNDFSQELLDIIADEVNVKEVKTGGPEISLDTNLTPELIEEGKVRDAIRAIQEWRKEKNLTPGEKASYEVAEADKELFVKYAEEIKKVTNVEF
jgi:isoleucyl-tRNA synthetase